MDIRLQGQHSMSGVMKKVFEYVFRSSTSVHAQPCGNHDLHSATSKYLPETSLSYMYQGVCPLSEQEQREAEGTWMCKLHRYFAPNQTQRASNKIM